jgi:MraZ protein
VFRGRYEHTIDAKGRLSIPSKFRDVLADGYDSTLVVTTFGECLIAYPHGEWKVLEERIAGLPEFGKETRAFLRHFYANAADCPIDKLGRILIPQPLRELARLDKDVILMGTFKQFEVWGKEVWEKSQAQVSHEEISGMLEKLGL